MNPFMQVARQVADLLESYDPEAGAKLRPLIIHHRDDPLRMICVGKIAEIINRYSAPFGLWENFDRVLALASFFTESQNRQIRSESFTITQLSRIECKDHFLEKHGPRKVLNRIKFVHENYAQVSIGYDHLNDKFHGVCILADTDAEMLRLYFKDKEAFYALYYPTEEDAVLGKLRLS